MLQMEEDALWYLFRAWQRTMHEFVEDLQGVEVIADDFLIAGFGNTEIEVNQSLERNERTFLEKCRQWNLKLNRAKVRRQQSCAIYGSSTHFPRPKT